MSNVKGGLNSRLMVSIIKGGIRQTSHVPNRYLGSVYSEFLQLRALASNQYVSMCPFSMGLLSWRFDSLRGRQSPGVARARTPVPPSNP